MITVQESTFVLPEEFVSPTSRLFIDTNVFMDTDETREGGLKQLFSRCLDAIRTTGERIVIPTKVVEELEKKSLVDGAELTDAIGKARNALVFIESAHKAGLVRADLVARV